MVLTDIEYEDLIEEVLHRFSMANIDGTLPELLKKLGWESLLENEAEPLCTFNYGKILVIGAPTVGIDILRLTAKKLGLDINRFEFELDYEGASTYDYEKLAYNANYRVILVGAIPHSTTGTGQSSSLLAELEKHPDKYPRTIGLRSGDGTLKITKSNFKSILTQLIEENYIAA